MLSLDAQEVGMYRGMLRFWCFSFLLLVYISHMSILLLNKLGLKFGMILSKNVLERSTARFKGGVTALATFQLVNC